MGSVLGGVPDPGVSEIGAAGGEAIGDGTGAADFDRGLRAGAVLAFGEAFFGAAFTAFFATLRDLAGFRALAFILAFAGRTFFFTTLFLAARRLAFAAGRFFDLLFFAMVNLLLEIVRTRPESSPEKVRCHLRVMLESVTRIA